MSRSAERSLLWGALALQLGFVTRDQFLAAMSSWVRDKQRPIGNLLVDQRAINVDTRDLLDASIDRQLQAGELGMQKLAAAGMLQPIAEQLSGIGDIDLRTGLSRL